MPVRTGYKFLGWSYDKDFRYDAATKDKASVSKHSSEDGAFCSDLRKSDPWVYLSRCTIPDNDCFRAKIYAIWEPLYTYTFIYDLNRPGLNQEGYPQGNYLGKKDDSLSDSTWNGNGWTEVYNENEMIALRSDPDRFFASGNSSFLRVKNGLLQSDDYIFRGWQVSSYDRDIYNISIADYKELPDTETFPGRYTNINHNKTVNITDENAVEGLYSGWFYSSASATQPYPVVTYRIHGSGGRKAGAGSLDGIPYRGRVESASRQL